MAISPDTFNFTREDLLLAAITSQVPAAPAADEFLISPDKLAVCGLPKPSILRLLKLVAQYRSLVIRRIGSLPDPVLAQVARRIREFI